MRDPVEYLKRLPWVALLQIASFSVLLLAIVEILLDFGGRTVPLIRDALVLLLFPPLDTLVVLIMSFGLGAIAVILLEQLRRNVVITTGVLWALVPCLMLILVLKSFSNFPMFIAPTELSLIGMILGIFWYGKKYWRR